MLKYETIEALYLTLFVLFAFIDGLTNLSFIIIFSKAQFRTITFRYLRISALIDAFHAFIRLPIPFLMCTHYCSWGALSRLKCITWLNVYLIRFFISLSSLVSITIVIHRYWTFNNLQRAKRMSDRIRKIMFYYVILAILIHAPRFTEPIVTYYHTNITCLKLIGFLVESISNIIFLIIMIVFTILLTIKIRSRNRYLRELIVTISRYIDKDSILSNRLSFRQVSKEESKLTVLVCWISIIFIIDQCFGLFIYFVSSNLFGQQSSSTSHLISALIYNLLLTLFHFLNLFVYFKYNRNFRKTIKSLKLLKYLFNFSK